MTQDKQYQRQLAHDRLAHQFDDIMNSYDVQRRLQVLIDDFLGNMDLAGQLVLDAGCGTGRGTKRLEERGANVVALDLGANLLQYTVSHTTSEPVSSSILQLPFADNTFAVVFSSEVIEHTPDPLLAVREMTRVIKPGGYLSLSTPNWLWQPLVRLASAMSMRPYDGLENFVKTSDMRKTLNALDGELLKHQGLHLIPFQLTFLQPLSRYIDRFGESLLPLMINQCILFRKRRDSLSQD
jgi:2-polyprenyl-3-methyl-5-hydroxy-6-metoxy-1,4-benzoquinol methylase